MKTTRMVVATVVGALLGVGCASTNARGPLAATRQVLADRGVAELEWHRDDASRGEALERSREILAKPLTPDTAALVALLRSPRLQAELAELGIGQADLAQATRLANPGFSWQRLSGSGETSATAGLAADLVDWLTVPLRRRVAAAELERIKLEVAAAIFDEVGAAKIALVRYHAAVTLLPHLQYLTDLDRAIADYAAALHDAGNITELHRRAAEGDAVQSAAELIRIRLEADGRREDLLLALGISPAEVWRVEGDLTPPRLDQSPRAITELETEAMANRLDLAAARWAIAALESARSHTAVTRWLPVGVEVGIERERETDGVRLTGPTVSLALPLFDQGQASLARFDAELDRARSQHQALEAQVRSQVRRAVADLAAAHQLVELYRNQLVPARRRSTELTLREYYQMTIGTFELAVARQQELEAEHGLVEAIEASWVAQIELERALGRIDAIFSATPSPGLPPDHDPSNHHPSSHQPASEATP